MSKSTRKRKSNSNSETDTVQPKEKIRHKDEREELSQMLFGDSKAFLESLEEAEKEPGVTYADSGIGDNHPHSENIDVELKAAWEDEDDEGIEVGEALDAQKRKLPSGGINDRASKYSNLLKRKFESIAGTPSWAKLHKSTDDESVLRTVGFINKSAPSSLPSERLEFKKVKDLNSETYNEGPFINNIEFHSNSSVALVAGNKGIATLFAVDGKRNNKLHSVAFERYPILCAKFANNGDEAILGSRKRHIFIYDLKAAKAVRYNLPPGMTQCKTFVVSPDTLYFAVAGKWGEVHLMSAISKEKIATLKQDNEVTALEYSHDGKHLFGHSDTGEVTIWDVNNRKVKHKFIDEGCLQGSALSASQSNQFLACGSAQGVVNLYNMDDVLTKKLPKPRKAVMNLTTAISGLEFNSSSEILALSSVEIKNAVKLLHVGSGTVFKNFPNLQSDLGHLNTINFSPGGGFLALGNRNSVVSLFRLKYYKNY